MTDTGARLDLAHHHNVPVSGDDVQFAVAATPVAIQDDHALGLQVAGGHSFTVVAQSGISLIRHEAHRQYRARWRQGQIIGLWISIAVRQLWITP